MHQYASIFYITKDISKISTQLTQSKKGEKRNAKNAIKSRKTGNQKFL